VTAKVVSKSFMCLQSLFPVVIYRSSYNTKCNLFKLLPAKAISDYTMQQAIVINSILIIFLQILHTYVL